MLESTNRILSGVPISDAATNKESTCIRTEILHSDSTVNTLNLACDYNIVLQILEENHFVYLSWEGQVSAKAY